MNGRLALNGPLRDGAEGVDDLFRATSLEDHNTRTEDQRVPSNRVQIEIFVGLAVVLAALDWLINGRWVTAVVVAGAIVLGVGVRLARRRSETEKRPK